MEETLNNPTRFLRKFSWKNPIFSLEFSPRPSGFYYRVLPTGIFRCKYEQGLVGGECKQDTAQVFARKVPVWRHRANFDSTYSAPPTDKLSLKTTPNRIIRKIFGINVQFDYLFSILKLQCHYFFLRYFYFYYVNTLVKFKRFNNGLQGFMKNQITVRIYMGYNL